MSILFKKIDAWKMRFEENVKIMLMSTEEKRYFLWKKAALEAKKKGLITSCEICSEPIFPGEFVATGTLGNKEVIIHAGFHYTLEKPGAVFCETAAVGIGYWNGKQIDGTGESAAAECFRTGKTVAY